MLEQLKWQWMKSSQKQMLSSSASCNYVHLQECFPLCIINVFKMFLFANNFVQFYSSTNAALHQNQLLLQQFSLHSNKCLKISNWFKMKQILPRYIWTFYIDSNWTKIWNIISYQNQILPAGRLTDRIKYWLFRSLSDNKQGTPAVHFSSKRTNSQNSKLSNHSMFNSLLAFIGDWEIISKIVLVPKLIRSFHSQ